MQAVKAASRREYSTLTGHPSAAGGGFAGSAARRGRAGGRRNAGGGGRSVEGTQSAIDRSRLGQERRDLLQFPGERALQSGRAVQATLATGRLEARGKIACSRRAEG